MSVLFLGCLMSVVIFKKSGDVWRSRILASELLTMRTLIANYEINARKIPASIDIVIQYSCKTRNECFNLSINDKGQCVDPFGNAYLYDQKTGWIKSDTQKYINW